MAKEQHCAGEWETKKNCEDYRAKFIRRSEWDITLNSIFYDDRMEIRKGYFLMKTLFENYRNPMDLIVKL